MPNINEPIMYHINSYNDIVLCKINIANCNNTRVLIITYKNMYFNVFIIPYKVQTNEFFFYNNARSLY